MSTKLCCGIEVETEGSYLEEVEPDFWLCHEEGTLRGPHVELVLHKPTPLDELGPALRELEVLVECYPIHLTPRGSLHVHIDVRDMSHTQRYSVCLAYTLLERVLYSMSGNRVSNKYCVPVTRSAPVRELISALFSQDTVHPRDKLYSGLNLSSIECLGSLEFRMHSGTLNTSELLEWVTTLHDLVLGASNASPEEIIQAGQTFSGLRSFVINKLGARGLAKALESFQSKWSGYDTKIIEQIHFRALQLASQ